MLCLGIETSCDETALALMQDGRQIGASLATQADLHALFGGVVPELASREHYRFIGALYDDLMRRSGITLRDVDVIAVTRGPGLLGALLVGVAFAKGLALGANKPIVAVNHLHAHLLAASIENKLVFPALGLLVSGGHTHIYRMEAPDKLTVLGRTLDDAAGEACDKFAKMLGLPYPGGALLDALACRGTANLKLFPRPYTHVASLDFSFSGLKTAALTYLDAHPELAEEGRRLRASGIDSASLKLCDVCASYMSAVADTLRLKMARALDEELEKGCSPTSLVVAGGVAANTQVRAALGELARETGRPLLVPSRSLCTDNAVMVAHLGGLLAALGHGHELTFPAIPRGQILPEDAGRIHAPLEAHCLDSVSNGSGL